MSIRNLPGFIRSQIAEWRGALGWALTLRILRGKRSK